MKEKKTSRVYEVTNERAAELLIKPKTRRFLTPFIGSRKSIKEASDELSMKLVDLYPYVKKLEKAGLISVVGTLPGTGRDVKLYQTVADEFFVSYKVTPIVAAFEREERALNAELWHAFSEVLQTQTDEQNPWGLRFYKTATYEMSVVGSTSQGEPRNVLTDEGAVILLNWRKLMLDQKRARALKKELYEVLERYTEEADGLQAYLVRLGMAPLPRGE